MIKINTMPKEGESQTFDFKLMLEAMRGEFDVQ